MKKKKLLSHQREEKMVKEGMEEFVAKKANDLVLRYPGINFVEAVEKAKQEWEYLTAGMKSALSRLYNKSPEEQVEIYDGHATSYNFPAGSSMPLGQDSSDDSQSEEGLEQQPNNKQKKPYDIFFQFYSRHLKDQHQKWTSEKINKIISLLWKKRKLSFQALQNKQYEFRKFIAHKDKMIKIPRPAKSALQLFFAQFRRVNHGRKATKVDWANLDKEEKSQFEKLSAEEEQRYKKDQEEYKKWQESLVPMEWTGNEQIQRKGLKRIARVNKIGKPNPLQSLLQHQKKPQPQSIPNPFGGRQSFIHLPIQSVLFPPNPQQPQPPQSSHLLPTYPTSCSPSNNPSNNRNIQYQQYQQQEDQQFKLKLK